MSGLGKKFVLTNALAYFSGLQMSMSQSFDEMTPEELFLETLTTFSLKQTWVQCYNINFLQL
jgi:hypothetical protein